MYVFMYVMYGYVSIYLSMLSCDGSVTYRPLPCACFLWCLLSSAPGQVFPAPWAVSHDCHTLPSTVNIINIWAWLKTASEFNSNLHERWCGCVSNVLFCNVWYSCVLWPLGLPIFSLPCSDYAPQLFLSLTPVDDSDIHKKYIFRGMSIHMYNVPKANTPVYKCKH